MSIFLGNPRDRFGGVGPDRALSCAVCQVFVKSSARLAGRSRSHTTSSRPTEGNDVPYEIASRNVVDVEPSPASHSHKLVRRRKIVKFTIYKSGTEFRWNLKAGNNEIIASGESYKNKADCIAAVNLVKNTSAATPTEDVT